MYLLLSKTQLTILETDDHVYIFITIILPIQYNSKFLVFFSIGHHKISDHRQVSLRTVRHR